MSLSASLLPLPNRIASTAAPCPVFPVGNHACVVRREFMASNAVSRLCDHAPSDVLAITDHFKMVWVDTSSRSTQVVDNHVIGNWFTELLVTPSVGANSPSAGYKDSIPLSVNCSAPEPTAALLWFNKDDGIGCARITFGPLVQDGFSPPLPVHHTHAATFMGTGADGDRAEAEDSCHSD